MKNSLLIATMLISVLCFAQKPKWGRVYEAETKRFAPNIIGESEKYLYSYFEDGDEVLFEAYDKRKLDREYSKLVEVPEYNGKQMNLNKVTFFDGNFLLFASEYDKPNKEHILKAFSYNANDGRSDKDFIIFKNEVERAGRFGNFEVISSKNKKTILVHSSTFYKELGQTVDLIKLYGEGMEEILSKEYVREGRSTGGLGNIRLDDEGSIYFLDGGEIVMLDANSEYEEWREPIEVKNKEVNGEITGFFFTLDKNNDLVLTGFYETTDIEDEENANKARSDRKEGDKQLEGVFCMKLNTLTKETEYAVLSKFDQDFIDQFKTEKDIKKGRDVEVEDIFSQGKFYFTSEGNVVFVGERFYVINHYTNGNLEGQNFYYKDLVVCNFNTGGEMEWAHRIPKNQEFAWGSFLLGFTKGSYGWSWMSIPMRYQGHYSYMAGVTDDKVFVVYNDHVKNTNLQSDNADTKTMYKFKKSLPVLYTLDLETGIKLRETNLSYASGDLILMPSVNYQNSTEEPLYIFAQNKKAFRFGKIDLLKGGRKRARR